MPAARRGFFIAAWSRAEHDRALAVEARLRAAAYHPAYSRFKKGMTSAEVEALFGRGPDQAFLEGPMATRRWDVADRWFAVFFDADGRVTDKFFKLTTPGPDSERIEGSARPTTDPFPLAFLPDAPDD